MCGIAGWIRPNGLRMSAVISMNQKAAHRGPDGEAYWIWDGKSSSDGILKRDLPGLGEKTGIVGLGHKRLAILDLSDKGLQPMGTPDHVLWIVFNGEIFNYIELRDELTKAGRVFSTGTDTEIILHAYQEWGPRCFQKMNGMWGLVLIDLHRRTAVFSRDRAGIKPLYLWTGPDSLAFASEPKQFADLPGFQHRGNVDSVLEYIATGYDNGHETLFKNVYSFPEGCWMEISLDQPRYPATAVRFWEPPQHTTSTKPADAHHQLASLFQDAVKLCLRSDVPVGVSLSGGLDSSAIYGQIAKLSGGGGDRHAFSAVFDDPQFDERPYIRDVLKKFGGKYHESKPDPLKFFQEFDQFIYHHDEPPGSMAQYAAWCVMRDAKQNAVPVILNGQGGDELFGGYWPAYYQYLRQIMFQNPFTLLKHLTGACLPGGNPDLVRVFPAFFQRFLSRKKNDNMKILHPDHQNHIPSGTGWAHTAQNLNSHQYRLREALHIHLPRLLKWDDRNSMAFGIEGRYPLLDHRIMDFAFSLPVEMNFKKGWNKLLFRNALSHLMPEPICWRRSKVGFETPQSEWIRTIFRDSLYQWAQNPSPRITQILDKDKLRNLAEAIFKQNVLHKMDERQILFMRVFFLSRWMDLFKIELESA